jgi:hypothetical protein
MSCLRCSRLCACWDGSRTCTICSPTTSRRSLMWCPGQPSAPPTSHEHWRSSSLPELHELLVAVCSCIRTAQAAGSRLFEGAPLVSDLLVDLSVECPAGLASIANLQTLTRRPTSSGAHVQQTCDVTVESLTGGRFGLTPQPEQIAMSLLSQWLESSGFRGFDVLAELVGPP